MPFLVGSARLGDRIGDEVRDFFKRPDMIGNSGLHRRRDLQGFVDAPEVVVHKMKRNRMFEVFDLLAKPVRQAGKASHPHSHSEILAFNVAG